tara:strand:- start:464 stop:901 length:438 start_codon:yes stop_codon:yes gene_type:complete
METVSFNLSKMLTKKCLEMNENPDFADRFIEYIELYERAKNISVSTESIIRAVETMYGKDALMDIFKQGTSYDKYKKEILGLYTMLMRHIKSSSHREIAHNIKADYTTIYKNYSWYMIRLYKDSSVRDKHDGALNFIVEHYKYSV